MKRQVGRMERKKPRESKSRIQKRKETMIGSEPDREEEEESGSGWGRRETPQTSQQYLCCFLSEVPFLHESHVHVCALSQSLQSCLTLCDPMDYRLSGSSVHGILPARILEWVATPSSRGSSRPRD